MAKIIYGLSYCEDDGSSESYNWFYMPKELFEDEAVREQRKAILASRNPLLEFEEWTSTTITDPEHGLVDADNSADVGFGFEEEIQPTLTLDGGNQTTSLQLPLLDEDLDETAAKILKFEAKILIFHYEMADEEAPRSASSPITVQCYWSHARDRKLLRDDCRYKSLESFGPTMDGIMDKLGAKNAILSSHWDISAVDASPNSEHSHAWLYLHGGKIIAEGLGEVPDHGHLCFSWYI